MRYKLIHIITGLNTGGAEMMLCKLLSKMNQEKFEIKVISLTDIGPVGGKIKQLGIPVIGLGMQRGVPNPFFILKLAKILRKENPDILQTWMYHADLLGLLSGKLAGIKNIVWNIRHSNLDPTINKKQTIMVAKLCSMLSSNPSRIICCSQASLDCHKDLGYNKEKMVVIPNGFNLDLFKPNKHSKQLLEELSLEEDVFLVGHVARWDGQKDHANLIKAAKFVIEEQPNVHFVLCGDGINDNNETLSSLIKEEGIEGNIHLMGRRDDIPELMPQFDLLVSSSKAGEGFPNVIGEAMSCEVPCVVTDVGDSAYIVGNTGFVVPPEKPDLLAKAIIQFLSLSKNEREHLGKLARERVQNYFSLDLIVKRYEKVYLELLLNNI
jgi:glycosyltransferase involved in cell wall biosynthesis